MRSLPSLALGLVLAVGATSPVRAADPPENAPDAARIDVWPGPPPGESAGPVGEETAKVDPKTKAVTSLTNVSRPTLSVFRPAPGKANGVAVIVAPGGGYTNLAWGHEGEQAARWLNTIGVTAFVLKYRVPRRPDDPKDKPPLHALMDAQRAISLVRGKASAYGVDPNRIGMLGFSAGGHLTAAASTNADRRAYDPVDVTDRVSCRPDFAVLVYPGGLVAKGTVELSPEIRVSSKTPPTLLVHAHDDRVSPENSVAYYLALKHADVPAELLVFGSGGHGFGMRPGKHLAADWPKRCEEWMRDRGLLTSDARPPSE